ncbi:MAG: di-heme oxidoredictase family protein [Planctomycetota bacterium]
MQWPFSRVAALLFVGLACASPTADAQVVPQPKLGGPVHGLTLTEDDRFDLGKIQYEREFNASEGLGPGFNQAGCGTCHNAPTVGGSGTTSVTRFGFVEKGVPFDDLASLGGSLLQAQSISPTCQEFVPATANVTTARMTTSTFGLGLIEAILDSDIIGNETAQASSPSTVAGHVHYVPMLEAPAAPLRPGRFGWKAQVATVLTFSGDAALNEMGITNRLVPNENMPNGSMATLLACDTVADPEDGPDAQGFDFIDRITDFQRFLAPPPQTPRSGMTGETIFNQIGCAECHRPAYTTGPAPEPSLANQAIRPYSDFLVHDMGLLGDGIVQGGALDLEMRTPALWGLRWRDPLLHDGRVSGGTFTNRMIDTINEHSGQGQASKDAFNLLSVADQDALVSFLDSLGQHEFDVDNNIFIDYADFEDFWACYVGSYANAYTPDDDCAIHDVDQDGDVDDDDFAVFLMVHEGLLVDCNNNLIPDMEELINGTASDCNHNAIPDECDLLAGTSLDMNSNNLPDECEVFRRADCNSDGAQNVADAVFSLSHLFVVGSETPLCEDACDANDDGMHDIADPVRLLTHLFSAALAPPAPYPGCGNDGTDTDSLPCTTTSTCP